MGLCARVVGEAVEAVEDFVVVVEMVDVRVLLDLEVEDDEVALVELGGEEVEVLVLEVELEVAVDDTAREETAGRPYNSSLFPLPQYSRALPLQSILQSDRGALVLDSATVLPQ